jgi:hypothetical protein
MDIGLQVSMSHGDFCPWNFLKHEDILSLIDWEMAAIRPLGYDLFTYIFQPTFLFSTVHGNNLLKILDENISFVKMYFSAFGIESFLPYLRNFVHIKIDYEREKDNSISLIEQYNNLLSHIK